MRQAHAPLALAAFIALFAAAGCDDVPDRFLLEDTQFEHIGQHKNLAVKIELYAPEGKTAADADHLVILSTKGALGVQAGGEQIWTAVKASLGADRIGYERTALDDAVPVGERSARLCGVGRMGASPMKLNAAIFEHDGYWALLGEMMNLGGDWRDADARDVCFDGDAESDAVLRLGRVLLND